MARGLRLLSRSLRASPSGAVNVPPSGDGLPTCAASVSRHGGWSHIFIHAAARGHTPHGDLLLLLLDLSIVYGCMLYPVRCSCGYLSCQRHGAPQGRLRARGCGPSFTIASQGQLRWPTRGRQRATTAYYTSQRHRYLVPEAPQGRRQGSARGTAFWRIMDMSQEFLGHVLSFGEATLDPWPRCR
eukprot:5496395-Prymnesium_polylepis.1